MDGQADDLGWFWDWCERHCDLIERRDWPPIEAEFWALHRRSFARHGVTEAVARDASDRLAESPPKFLDAHLTAFLSAVQRVRAAQAPPRPAVADAVDAERDARDRARWDALPEADREAWLARVRAHFPGLAHRASFVEANAIVWSAEPESAPPARPNDPPPRPVRRRWWSSRGRVAPNVFE